MTGLVPKELADLAPLVEQGWAQGTMNGRMRKRRESTAEEIRAFYDAILPRTKAVVDHMNGYPYPDAPDDAKRAFYLLLMLAEVAPHVEQFGGSPEVPYAFDERRFIVSHGDVEGHWG